MNLLVSNFLLSLLASSCDCGNAPVALAEVPNLTCLPKIGQILRLWFVRGNQVIWNSTTPASNIPATITTNLISQAAGWTTLFAAADSTKVVKTPVIGGNPTITGGTPITQGGGDNSTANGITIYQGSTPDTFSADFFNLDPTQIIAIRKLICEENLEVYFVNHESKILHKKDGTAPILLTGFKVLNVYLGPKTNAGQIVADVNTITFTLEKGWDEFLAFATPAAGFNPLTV